MISDLVILCRSCYLLSVKAVTSFSNSAHRLLHRTHVRLIILFSKKALCKVFATADSTVEDEMNVGYFKFSMF